MEVLCTWNCPSKLGGGSPKGSRVSQIGQVASPQGLKATSWKENNELTFYHASYFLEKKVKHEELLIYLPADKAEGPWDHAGGQGLGSQ